MDNLPTTWDEWIANFSDWQDRVGYDRSWLGDFDLSIQFDWERAGDVIEFGDYKGRPKWERSLQVPQQSMRDALISMITVQGDTEFASVEQQRHLLASAPTAYDKYAAARIMAEEQRHGWQMAYLLMTYFGQQGRREAQKLLERNAQDGDRLLGAFNRPMPHWLDFFCYTMFVDRDGKFQLGMLSTSSFKPVAASMGPMLKEESFHLGTGSNGLRRVIKAGVIPLDLLHQTSKADFLVRTFQHFLLLFDENLVLVPLDNLSHNAFPMDLSCEQQALRQIQFHLNQCLVL